MKKAYYFILVAIGLLGMSSCTQDDYELQNELLSSNVESRTSSTDSISTNSNITPIIVKPDSIKRHIKSRANYYNENLSNNLFAIATNSLWCTIQSNEGEETDNHYLTTNGIGQAITLNPFKSDYREQMHQLFYIKVLPATSGIPYLIYSYSNGTPLGVGQRESDPNNKVLFTMQDDSSLYSASWDIYKATNKSGCLVIESQSYIGQGDSGNWMDVFYHVWETKGSNPVGFGKYQQKKSQEFIITPTVTFTLKDIKFINDYSAVVTQTGTKSITSSHQNNSYQPDNSYVMHFNGQENELSSFIEDKSINFKLGGLDQMFKRPTVIQGKINLVPNDDAKGDAIYATSQNIKKTISASLPISIPPRTKMEVTYIFRKYNVEADYEAVAEFARRGGGKVITIKLIGKWKGTLYVDEKDEPIIKKINLDTGNVQSVRKDIKKIDKNNPLKI